MEVSHADATGLDRLWSAADTHEGMHVGSRDAGWVTSPGRQVQKLPGEGPPTPALLMEVSAG